MNIPVIRPWRSDDDPDLVSILTRQLKHDKAWPPAYAQQQDLATWLAKPANLARWVAVDPEQRVIGHMGLGTPAEAYQTLFAAAMDSSVYEYAELCRTCIDPDHRKSGLAGTLTRTAIKHAIKMKKIPVSTVLTNRSGWLSMMLRTGWRDVGKLPGKTPGDELVCLLAPQKFIDAALSR
ncbi:MAG: GNAT family N-acetyltransferase [Pseudomonadota bacterium]